jgi:hypothetical protein
MENASGMFMRRACCEKHRYCLMPESWHGAARPSRPGYIPAILQGYPGRFGNVPVPGVSASLPVITAANPDNLLSGEELVKRLFPPGA